MSVSHMVSVEYLGIVTTSSQPRLMKPDKLVRRKCIVGGGADGI